MGRGKQGEEQAGRGGPRRGHDRTPLLHAIEGSFGDVIDYGLLEEDALGAREKYEELARGYKALADEAWIRYRQATDLWVYCKAKARGTDRQRRREREATDLAEALRLT